MEKKFTFKTRQGSMRLFVLLVAIVLALALIAQAIVTNGYKVTVSEVNMEIRGGRLNMEIYRPTKITKDTKLPCMILAHGGSECIATPSIHAWEYAKRGFVVINVNMYGAGLSDMPEYMEDGADENNYSRNSGTHGLWDALEYARTIDYVDNTRIGIWGHSQGYTIGGTVPVYDQNMYTLNDRLLNVLYNEFGIQIPEEDLLKNADDIAKAKLNAAQMAVYKVRKAECEEIVANYVKAVRIIESGSINLKCTVAGHEVTRNLQCNLQVGGETRGGACGPFVNVNNRQDLGLFNRTEPLTDNSWFAVGDANEANPNGTSTLLGGIYDVTVNNSSALKAAIDDNNAYFFYDPVIHHNGNLWNTTAIGYTLQFFTQCLGYNNGELSDPATQPISCKNIASSWIALFIMCAAMLVMTIAICALGSALLKTDYFSTCLKPCYKSKLAAGSKDFWIATALAVVTAFVGAWMSSRENIALKASNAFMSNFLPTEPGQWRTYFQIIATAACGFILFGVMSFIGRKTNKEVMPRFNELNVGISFKDIMKTCLLAFILFGTFYAACAVLKNMSCLRFVSVDVSWELMRPYVFVRMLKYTIAVLPFTLVISLLNNLTVVNNLNDSADTAVNVVITSIGAYIFVAVAYLIVFGPGTQTQMGSLQANMGIQTILPLFTLVPLFNYMYRRLYKISGSIWLGAFVVAIFIGWRNAAFASHRFMFWTYSGLVDRFFGI